MVAIKIALFESKIFGPGGDPDAPAIPSKYMKVPYEEPTARPEEVSPPLPDDERTTNLRRAASMALNGGRRALIHKMDAEDEALYHSGLETVPRENTVDTFTMQMPHGVVPHTEPPPMPEPEPYDVDHDRATPAQIEAGRVRIQSPDPIQPHPSQPPQSRERGGRNDYEMRRI